MRLTTLHIGGLIAMGFDPSGKYLLAVSHNGRGVFETTDWKSVARDYEPTYPEGNQVEGIGPLAGQQIGVKEKNYDTDELAIVDPHQRFECSLQDFGHVDVIAIDP